VQVCCLHLLTSPSLPALLLLLLQLLTTAAQIMTHLTAAIWTAAQSTFSKAWQCAWHDVNSILSATACLSSSNTHVLLSIA